MAIVFLLKKIVENGGKKINSVDGRIPGYTLNVLHYNRPAHWWCPCGGVHGAATASRTTSKRGYKVHPLPLIQTALVPGTSHTSSHPAPGEGNAHSIPHLRKLKILRAPVPHHLRVTNCSLKAKPPASENRGLLVSWHIHGHTTQSHFHIEVAALSEQLWQRPRGPRNQNSVL